MVRRRSTLGLLVIVLVACGTTGAQQPLPTIVVLATGGTIAGAAGTDVQAAYKSGQVGVDQLLAAVPQAAKVATLRGEQISNIGSQDMNDEVWLKLARRVNELAAMRDVSGIVITHGTDTIEETAYFLNLVVKSRKPVVLTASMRPSTALSADGPLNFFNAVAVAANKDAAGRGVLVVINDWIHGASSLTKTSTTAVQTFLSPVRGLIGTVAYGEAEFYRGPVGRNTVDSEFSLDGVTALPRVDIIMAHENMDGALINAAAAAGAKGIVIAGVGNGNMTQAAVSALAAQSKKGVVSVRSSRVLTGLVGRNVELNDDELGFVASLEHNPQKARVLLRLALTKTTDLEQIQRYFDEYLMLEATRLPSRGSLGTSWLPGLWLVRRYQVDWLRHDVVAGLVLSTMLVPAGIAYAEASGVPGIYGLYATIVPLLAYAVFGPSRILVLGPDSSLAAVILAVVLPLAGGDSARAVALAGMMAIVSGLVCVAAGLGRLGFVTELLSKPIRYGYMNGIALTVLLSQLPKLFGFSITAEGPLRQAWAFVEGVADGRTNVVTLAIGVTTLALILLVKRRPRVPGILIAVVGATIVAGVLDLSTQAGVAVLGPLPRGLPGFVFPLIGFDDLTPVLFGGVAVALVSFADTSVLSRVYAARLRAPVDPNQEMVGLGAANVAAGLFQGFPISSSSSRTPVAEAAGARSQLTGVVGALAIALMLLVAPGLLRHLPATALAAVVIAAAIGLIEVSDLRRIYRIQRWEFWLSMVCFVGVATLGAIPGIGLAIVIAVIEFLWDGWRPYSAVLGRIDSVKGYHDVTRHPEARRVPGLVLFRWDAPLFFANAELFHARVLDAVATSPTPVRWVVVAAEPVTSIDVTAADVVVELDEALHAQGTELCFAEIKGPVKDKLKRFGLFTRLGEEMFFPTIGAAVNAYLARHRVEWKD